VIGHYLPNKTKTYYSTLSSLFQTTIHRLKQPVVPPARLKARWRKPPQDVAKINCDGAFMQEERSGGWGFVIRSSEGEVIFTGFGNLKRVLEPFHAEIIACLQAVQRAADLGLQKVILETDALMVVQAALSSIDDRSSASGLVWELKALLRCNFSSWVVAHNPRSCNLVAHGLAALGYKLSPETAVFDNIPMCIYELLANDLAPVIE
jgi:ribonuclease HI